MSTFIVNGVTISTATYDDGSKVAFLPAVVGGDVNRHADRISISLDNPIDVIVDGPVKGHGRCDAEISCYIIPAANISPPSIDVETLKGLCEVVGTPLNCFDSESDYNDEVYARFLRKMEG